MTYILFVWLAVSQPVPVQMPTVYSSIEACNLAGATWEKSHAPKEQPRHLCQVKRAGSKF
jgi:hypothetical protein